MSAVFDNAEQQANLNQYIEHFERSYLEHAVPGPFGIESILDDRHSFYALQGLSDFWSSSGADFAQHFTDLVVGAHQQPLEDLTFVLCADQDELTVALSLGQDATTKTLLEGILPGIALQPLPTWKLLKNLDLPLRSGGFLTGIPSRRSDNMEPSSDQDQEEEKKQPSPPDKPDMSQLERVIRGMYGTSWSYIVQAHPRPRYKVTENRLMVIDLLAQINSLTRVQWQSTEQGSHQLTQTESNSQTKTYSGDMVNYRAQYLVRLLEHELKRLDRSSAAGQWTTTTYFGASNPNDVRRLASLLMGTFAGKNSRPDPLRAYICQEQQATPLSTFNTFLTSDELAMLIQLPREEFPGFAIHDFVRFDVDFHPPVTDTLEIGRIQQNNRETQRSYTISLGALAKHAVVVGVTGSGKTTTVMNLLDNMVEANKPFLVIEPAKTEYRALRSAFDGRADLRIYTLGNELVAPFRLNPFEFETTDDPENASLLTHIDFLKAVFNAAFTLYAPMPHVLETALHEVYEDKGWDIASGSNTRIPSWEDRDSYPIFPTLTDLYRKVEIVTNRLGYHDEVERNVKAGLKARIGSLRIGSKGLMLDTARSISMEQLLSTPTILEMESIGNDDEKTFIMGLFLAKLYEYRRTQAAEGTLASGLQHVIVFEEAHRLLKNTNTQVDSEGSNLRSQAIEVFTNMLSEVRAYGQGVLVAEQIPSKLAPDVLKNTNLKIVHRLIAQDDRESIGQTMNLNHDQITHLGILKPGAAAVYAEGDDHAYLVRLHNYKNQISPVTDALLKQISPAYASVQFYQSIPHMERYGFQLSAFGNPDFTTTQLAGKMLDSEKSTWLWGNILLRSVLSPTKLLEMLRRLSEHIEAEISSLQADEHAKTLRMVIVHGCAEVLQEHGARFGWTYPQVEEMRVILTNALLTLVENHELSSGLTDLYQFAMMYGTFMQRKQGPFAGCTHCQSKCLFRPTVNLLLSPKDVQQVDKELTRDGYETPEERYGALAAATTSIATRWIGEPSSAATGVGYCLALHAITRSDFTEYEQALVGDMLLPHL